MRRDEGRKVVVRGEGSVSPAACRAGPIENPV